MLEVQLLKDVVHCSPKSTVLILGKRYHHKILHMSCTWKLF